MTDQHTYVNDDGHVEPASSQKLAFQVDLAIVLVAGFLIFWYLQIPSIDEAFKKFADTVFWYSWKPLAIVPLAIFAVFILTLMFVGKKPATGFLPIPVRWISIGILVFASVQIPQSVDNMKLIAKTQRQYTTDLDKSKQELAESSANLKKLKDKGEQDKLSLERKYQEETAKKEAELKKIRDELAQEADAAKQEALKQAEKEKETELAKIKQEQAQEQAQQESHLKKIQEQIAGIREVDIDLDGEARERLDELSKKANQGEIQPGSEMVPPEQPKAQPSSKGLASAIAAGLFATIAAVTGNPAAIFAAICAALDFGGMSQEEQQVIAQFATKCIQGEKIQPQEVVKFIQELGQKELKDYDKILDDLNKLLTCLAEQGTFQPDEIQTSRQALEESRGQLRKAAQKKREEANGIVLNELREKLKPEETLKKLRVADKQFLVDLSTEFQGKGMKPEFIQAEIMDWARVSKLSDAERQGLYKALQEVMGD